MVAQGAKQIPLILLRRGRSSRIHHQVEQAKILDSKEQVKRDCDSELVKAKTKRIRSSAATIDIKVKVDADQKSDIKQLVHQADNPIDPDKFDGLLDIDVEELNLERTLLGGQSFRWTKSICDHDDKQVDLFTGVVKNMVVRLWRLNSDQIAYTLLNEDQGVVDVSKVNAFFSDYFQLRYNLKDLYRTWSSKDKHLEQCCKDYVGFRILRQDPVENVFSFICATNNNIKRISQMVDKLCGRFGDHLMGSYHKFPAIERLAGQDVEDCLRNELGFGYRAKYIVGAAKKLLEICDGDKQAPDEYLLALRQLPYKETCRQLLQLPGIGRKVADCICLMSMDHLNAVPTDCHIYEIVCRNYIPELRKQKANVTEKIHDQIGEYFNDLHGSLAGWSTSVLFIGELKHLKMETTTKSKAKKSKS